MKYKHVITFLLIVILSALTVSVASAQRGGNDDRRGGFGDRGWLEIVVEFTGLTPAEIRQQMHDGATMAEIIVGSGADLDAFIATMTDNFEGRLDGWLSSEITSGMWREGFPMLEGRCPFMAGCPFMEGRPFMDRGSFGERGNRGGMFGQRGAGGGADGGVLMDRSMLLEELTGLDRVEIMQRLRAESASELLAAFDVDVEDAIIRAAEIIEARLDLMVEAGRITPEQAETRLNALIDALNTWLTSR